MKKVKYESKNFYNLSEENPLTNNIELPDWVLKCPRDFQNLYEDIISTRTLNQAQEEIINCFFRDNCGRVFLRIGRKGSKTSTIILVAWLFSHYRENPTITNILYPTKEQGYDVMLEENRLQYCDLLHDSKLYDKWVSNFDDKKMILTFANESKIRIHGTWTEKRGRGVQPDLLIPDELKDINAEFLDGFEPNLAAKPDSRFLLAGTPPKVRNHYHEWEERTSKKLKGRCFHYSSYINTSLPHLKQWLDDTKEELIAAGKEDEWLREYMAEDCFSSEDRLLPDADFHEHQTIMDEIKSIEPNKKSYAIGLRVTMKKICAIFFVIEKDPKSIARIFAVDYILKKNVWDGSYKEFCENLPNKCAELFPIPFKDWRKWLCDETNSFSSVIPSYNLCSNANGFLWNVRGISLTREMINREALIFSDRLYPIGMEIQSILVGDKFDEFPFVATTAMVINEYFREPPRVVKPQREKTDIELICDKLNLKYPKKRSERSIISYNWHK